MIKRIHSTLLLCSDISQTTQFYQRIGFSLEKSDQTVRIHFGDYRLTFTDEHTSALQDSLKDKKGIGMFLFFEVENVDSFYQELQEKGVPVSSEPEGRPGGKRRFTVHDPDGYKLVFYTERMGQ